MGEPPCDQDGVVTPHDDYDLIPDDALLVRYVQKMHLARQDDGRQRLSSGAFSATSKDRDRYRGMSVDIYSLLLRDGKNIAARMPPEHEGAILLWAGCLRQLGLKIGPDPMDAADPYHACVWGVSRGLAKRIRKSCCDRWLIQPPNTAPI